MIAKSFLQLVCVMLCCAVWPSSRVAHSNKPQIFIQIRTSAKNMNQWATLPNAELAQFGQCPKSVNGKKSKEKTQQSKTLKSVLVAAKSSPMWWKRSDRDILFHCSVHVKKGKFYFQSFGCNGGPSETVKLPTCTYRINLRAFFAIKCTSWWELYVDGCLFSYVTAPLQRQLGVCEVKWEISWLFVL